MNKYCYNEILLGYTYEFSVQMDSKKQEMFQLISGDNNPLHTDGNFARNGNFDDKVVYGLLTASYYSTLIGMYIPGENALIHEVNTKFNKPVYLNDTLIISGKVVEKIDLFNLLIVKATIKNQHGDIVSKAKIKVGVLK